MQIYAINGSPRKKWNTGTILQNALDGAAESAPDVLTETINLYDYNYKGCISCFQCKRIGGPSYGKCAVKDDMGLILQNVLNADAVIFGSPIYFGEITGMMRCFLERLFFPCFVYDKNYSSIAPKKVHTAFVYTMNVNVDVMQKMGYPARLGLMEGFAHKLFGFKPRLQYVNDTYQFNDYSKYKMEVFSEADKAKQRELQFPVDCANARELGAALVADVKGEPDPFGIDADS